MKAPLKGSIKRAVAILLAAACLPVLGGCNQSDPTPPQTTGFSCEITAVCDDLTVQGTLSRPTAEQLSLTVTQPETLSGLALAWDGTALSARWHGLSVPLDRELLPDTSLIEGLISSLDAALGAAGTGTVTEEGTVIEGQAGGHPFCLIADPATGMLRSLDIPDLDIAVTFESR